MCDLAFLNPAIRTTSLPAIVHGIYTALVEEGSVDLGQLLLFMAIVAYTSYNCSSGSRICTIFGSHMDANLHSLHWSTAAVELVDELKKGCQFSIESLQGQTVLYKLLVFRDGSNLQNHGLLLTSISMARTMGLHRIDLTSDIVRNGLGIKTQVDLEIARRLWWDLVATDWYP